MNKVPPVKELYKKVSKNVLHPNTAFVGELWYSRLLGRRLSIYFTWLFLHTNMSPNTLTLIHTIMSVTGSALFASTNIWMQLVGFILFNLYLILDSSDGEMARYKKQTGAFGSYIDTLSHISIYVTLYCAIGINIFLRTGNVILLYFGAVTAILYSLGSAIHHLDPLLKKVTYIELRKGENRLVFWGTNIYNFLTSDLTIVFYIFFVTLFGYRKIAGYEPYTLLLILNFILVFFGGVIFNLVKKIRDPRYYKS